MFDLMLDQPLEPGFLFFGNFDFHGVGTVERGHDSDDALLIDASSVLAPYPPFSFGDRFGHALFSRLCNKVCDVVPESRRHLERWEFRFLDGVDEGRHG